MNAIDFWKQQVQHLNARLSVITNLLTSSIYNLEQRQALEKEGYKVLEEIKQLNDSIFVETQILEFISMQNKMNEISSTVH